MLCFGLYTYVKATESRAAAAASKSPVVQALVSDAPEGRLHFVFFLMSAISILPLGIARATFSAVLDGAIDSPVKAVSTNRQTDRHLV